MTTLAGTSLVPTDTQRRNDSLDANAAPAQQSLDSTPLTPKALAGLAVEFAARSEIWRPLLHVDPDRRWYTRLRVGAGWEAWLLTWLPGQGTDLHDHGGSSGAFAVLFGDLQESTPAPAGSDPTRLASHVFRPGQVRAFGASHVHQVTGVGDGVAASLHVYGPALTVMNRYDLDPALGPIIASTERAGQDW
jgi:predicted metal-dependent enzyme (double-stranded beta helix superfamily)